jgi:CxxC motif-containing protein
VESYLTLNDSIIHIIENSKSVSLIQSQSLIKKLKTRDIYKFVNEVIISTDLKLDTVVITNKKNIFIVFIKFIY